MYANWNHFEPDYLRISSTPLKTYDYHEKLPDAPFVLFCWDDESGYDICSGDSVAEVIAEFTDIMNEEWDLDEPATDSDAITTIESSQVDRDSQPGYTIIDLSLGKQQLTPGNIPE